MGKLALHDSKTVKTELGLIEPRTELQFDILKAVGFTLSKDGRLSWNSPALIARLLQCHVTDIPKTYESWLGHIHPEDRYDYKQRLSSLGWDGARYEANYRLQISDDRLIWIEEAAQRVTSHEKEPGTITGVLRDVTRQRETENRAVWLSQFDVTTSLPKLPNFVKSAETLTALGRRLSSQGAFMRIRLMNLDDVNLIYGFEAGEKLLSAMADRLRSIVQAPDIIGTANATDFLVGVIGVQGSDADPQILGERLFRALSDVPYVTPQGRLRAQVRIGHAIFPQASRPVSDLLAQTERALSYEKTSPVIAYAPIMGLPSQNREQAPFTEGDIVAALNERRISLAYQPIIHARSRELHHYECLLRLRQEDGQLVSAGHLIMAAEKLGHAPLLDLRALEIAAVSLKDDEELRLALNVSAETIKSDKASEEYIHALKSFGILTERLTLELTETAALDDPAKASLFSNACRALGCDFAIDDFGSGYTSFQNLMAIEAETIKIDGSLIKGISTTPHIQSFVRMMVDLAQTFSVKTVAEMVENPADAEILKRLGVDYLQGYLFGLPSPVPSYTL